MRYPDPPLEDEEPPFDAVEARPTRPPRPPGPPLRDRIRMVLVLALATAVAAFALQNLEPVRIEFLGAATRAGLVWIIATAAVVGFIVGWLIGRPSREERRRLRGR